MALLKQVVISLIIYLLFKSFGRLWNEYQSSLEPNTARCFSCSLNGGKTDVIPIDFIETHLSYHNPDDWVHMELRLEKKDPGGT